MTISVKGIIHFHPDKGLIHPMSDLQGQLRKTAIIVNRKLFLLAWCEMKLISLKLIKARHFRSIIFHGSQTVETFYLQLHHEQIVKIYVLISFKQLFFQFLLHVRTTILRHYFGHSRRDVVLQCSYLIVHCIEFASLKDRKWIYPGRNIQRTNGPVNARLISWPTKAQNIQNLENIW